MHSSSWMKNSYLFAATFALALVFFHCLPSPNLEGLPCQKDGDCAGLRCSNQGICILLGQQQEPAQEPSVETPQKETTTESPTANETKVPENVVHENTSPEKSREILPEEVIMEPDAGPKEQAVSDAGGTEHSNPTDTMLPDTRPPESCIMPLPEPGGFPDQPAPDAPIVQPKWQWVKGIGNIHRDPKEHRVLFDSKGNMYLVGGFGGTLTLGKHTLKASSRLSMFVAKMDPKGDWLWAKSAGGQGQDQVIAFGVNFGPKGNLYVVGSFGPEATIGSNTLIAQGGSDIFIAKLDTSGTWLSSEQLKGPGMGQAYHVTFDSKGDMILIGRFDKETTFGNITLKVRYYHDGFIAKRSAAGKWLWAKRMDSDLNHFDDVVVDSKDNIYAAAHVRDGWIFEGLVGPPDYSLGRILVFKLTPGGKLVWLREFLRDARYRGLKMLQQKYLFGAVKINQELKYQKNSTFPKKITASQDMVIFKADLNGCGYWVRKFGDRYGEDMWIDVDSKGDIYMSGIFERRGRFGGKLYNAIGVRDMVVAKMDAAGNWKWVQQIGNKGTAFKDPIRVFSDGLGSFYVLGRVTGSVKFGTHTFTPKTKETFFIAKFK